VAQWWLGHDQVEIRATQIQHPGNTPALVDGNCRLRRELVVDGCNAGPHIIAVE